ncbi:unnamed protein product [Kluyveromyces dobzhanskii CBS 2104]|uniref:WGS project CCBQ000000000 data, contig 00058 n=1 Tax=Kluyveromyces dobzhanskii CBS 2104 TaxID=1427455 RepID=A0A0A8LDL0_9SACH|nr:unnamed protein product [Kluyveromyces dobzhanskii CBS 2104]
MTLSENEDLAYLRSILSVRETCEKVYGKSLGKNNGKSKHFDVSTDKMSKVADYLLNIIERDYQNLADIPVHGRWQHLNCNGVDRMDNLIQKWTSEGHDSLEVCRRLIDLITFSVIVDAGAGSTWNYKEGETLIGRSEGLAIASFYMFQKGDLSKDKSQTVNGATLKSFDKADFDKGFQISAENSLQGYEGRIELIRSLGNSLLEKPELFGDDARPGNIIDYLFKLNNSNEIDLQQVWEALMTGYTSIWPKGRLTLHGQPLGDCWKYKTESGEIIVTFHKLTQWLCYSLLRPLEQFGYKFKISSKDLQTGLPEYRNGGLFYDLGVITLKEEFLNIGLENSQRYGYDPSIPTFEPDSAVIVEWRCLTIGLLDALLPSVNSKLGSKLQLSQLIEAGTWKAGREIAAELRPKTAGPPINLHSDGTVF